MLLSYFNGKLLDAFFRIPLLSFDVSPTNCVLDMKDLKAALFQILALNLFASSLD